MVHSSGFYESLLLLVWRRRGWIYLFIYLCIFFSPAVVDVQARRWAAGTGQQAESISILTGSQERHHHHHHHPPSAVTRTTAPHKKIKTHTHTGAVFPSEERYKSHRKQQDAGLYRDDHHVSSVCQAGAPEEAAGAWPQPESRHLSGSGCEYTLVYLSSVSGSLL